MIPLDCPYCANISGLNAGSPRRPRSDFDQVLAGSADVVIVPTVGMLLPGYLLAVTRTHVESFAQLDPEVLATAWDWIQKRVDQLSFAYGSYLLFEHGSGGTQPSGGCVSHAHLHLIPGVREQEEVLIEALHAQPMDLTELSSFANNNYALIQGAGMHIATDTDLPSQWIRRRVAEALGTPENYDWALFPGEENLKKTLNEARVVLDS